MSYLITILVALFVSFGSAVYHHGGQLESLTERIADVKMDALGADIKLFAGFPYYLSGTGISSSATSFTLTSFTIPQNGYTIQDSDLESTFYITFEPGNRNRQELASCTTVLQNSDGTATISGCSRGLSPIQPYTASTSLQFAHGGGSSVIFSDAPQLFDDLYDYVNSLALGSTTVSATTLAAGFVELATQAEMAAGTGTGGSGSSLVLQSLYATSSAPSSGSYVVVTGSSGNIAEGFIDFSSTTAVTIGSSPLLGPGRYLYATTTYGTSTWSVPSGIKKIKVTLVGAGGTGGTSEDTDSCTTSCGGGGGGGAGTAILFMDVSATATLQFHIASSWTEYSWFGGTYDNPTIRANSGGNASVATPGVGGTAAGGSLNITGSGGGPGVSRIGGTGGGSLLGGGAASVSSGNSTAATFCGAGGSGEWADNSAGNGGAAGYYGCLIIEY